MSSRGRYDDDHDDDDHDVDHDHDHDHEHDDEHDHDGEHEHDHEGEHDDEEEHGHHRPATAAQQQAQTGGHSTLVPPPHLTEEEKQQLNKEQDRLLPIANISRIMRRVLPDHAKMSRESKSAIQECVSEFIGFITSEASDRLLEEKRKTITGDDVIDSMRALGFNSYIDLLQLYLKKYRHSTKGSKPPSQSQPLAPGAHKRGRKARGADDDYSDDGAVHISASSSSSSSTSAPASSLSGLAGSMQAMQAAHAQAQLIAQRASVASAAASAALASNLPNQDALRNLEQANFIANKTSHDSKRRKG